jgi:hypothetical protein
MNINRSRLNITAAFSVKRHSVFRTVKQPADVFVVHNGNKNGENNCKYEKYYTVPKATPVKKRKTYCCEN